MKLKLNVDRSYCNRKGPAKKGDHHYAACKRGDRRKVKSLAQVLLSVTSLSCP